MSSGLYKKLQFEYAVLAARLQIRDHYVGTIIRNIYDNIGQLLSLARVQLAVDHLKGSPASPIPTGSPGELLEMAVRDLRELCNRLLLQESILDKDGLNQAVRQQLQLLYPDAVFSSANKATGNSALSQERCLILFSILLDLFSSIAAVTGNKISAVELVYTQKKLLANVHYGGRLIRQADLILPVQSLEIHHKIALLGGNIRLGRKSPHTIQLTIPLN